MDSRIGAVIDGKSSHAFVHADSLETLREMPEGSVDLIFGSPPYEDARLYGELEFDKAGERWVEWMVQFFKVAVPVTRGLVALVVGHGKTFRYKWSATPSLLEADLHRAGFHLRAPGLFDRVGIFGSGGPDYFRHDYEWIVTAQNTKYAARQGRGGPRLPWSNNTACGHPPIYGPGGAASYRTTSGRRINQWGGSNTKNKGAKKDGDNNKRLTGQRRPSGERQTRGRPSHIVTTEAESKGYKPPAIANPGNVADETYTAEEVREIIGGLEGSLISSGNVGFGHMGHKAAHDNEAPFPLWLAERFVLSFCPPGGVVLDPFSGSGTTVHAAVQNKRRGIGIDLRVGQVELARRRLEGVSPLLFVESDDEHQRRMEAKKGPAGEEADHHEEGEVAGGGPGLAGRAAREAKRMGKSSRPNRG